MKTLDKKKKQAPEPADPSKSDIGGLSADALETPVKSDDPPGKPENVPAGKSARKKLTDRDKSRLMGVAATAVCAGGLAVFVLYQFFSGMAGSPAPSGGTDAGRTDQPAVSVPGEAGQDGVDLGIQPDRTYEDSVSDPFNRGQWDDYKLETEDGDQAAEGRGAEVESGTRYWVRARDGSNMYKIVIPAGYVAQDLGDCITVGSGDYEATGSEPVTFFWRKGADIRCLLNDGWRDLAGNATGYDRYDLRALGYYLFQDESGDTWPVVTAVMTRDESNPEIETYQEYWIVVGKPAADNRYLVGTIPAESFGDISTQLCPNISAFAKALFPAWSVPDFPDTWSIPSDRPAAQETQAGPDGGDAVQEPGPEPAPGNMDQNPVPAGGQDGTSGPD